MGYYLKNKIIKLINLITDITKSVIKFSLNTTSVQLLKGCGCAMIISIFAHSPFRTNTMFGEIREVGGKNDYLASPIYKFL